MQALKEHIRRHALHVVPWFKASFSFLENTAIYDAIANRQPERSPA
jgi:hypothetical protein